MCLTEKMLLFVTLRSGLRESCLRDFRAHSWAMRIGEGVFKQKHA